MTQLLSRIAIDPAVCHGQPHIRGTRVMVSVVLDNLAMGVKEQELINEYPTLKPKDISASLAYAAAVSV